MPSERLPQVLLLPELQLVKTTAPYRGPTYFFCEKTSKMEVCPKCAQPARGVYDRRWVSVRDSPIRDRQVVLKIRKRRFWCRPCQKPFTEPVPGIGKGKRFTQRYRKGLLWACETYSSLKSVLNNFRCSAGFLYQNLYQELERRRRRRLYPWPKVIGIDEHYFRREHGFRQFVSMVVDFKGRRLMELVKGRSIAEMTAALSYIPGRENVRYVATDLCDPYKSFVKQFFPNATVVADKFHVLRLLNPAINRYRKEITGDKRSLPIRRLLLQNGHRLQRSLRFRLEYWLKQHPILAEVYYAKEALHRLYRTKGQRRVAHAYTHLTDTLARSAVPELKRLRKTLLAWRKQILAYFRNRLTNARTEGFNNVAKVVKKRAFGYKSFENYRLRLLNTCA